MAEKKGGKANRGSTGGMFHVDHDESSIKLRPGKIVHSPIRSQAFRTIMKVMRDGRRTASAKAQRTTSDVTIARKPKLQQPHKQQVAVRLTYTPNKQVGQWTAHGRYLEREAASGRAGAARGFGPDSDAVEISSTLGKWQTAGDRNLFKMIISPGEGRRLDLKEFTREYITQLETSLGTKLEWVAVDHYNTDDPHVHVAIRGLTDRQRELKFPPEFIKGPLREIAANLATGKLGYRTEHQIQSSRERQVEQHRFTELDRMIQRRATDLNGEPFIDFREPIKAGAMESAKELRIQQLRRMATLERMGLAKRVGQSNAWTLDPAMESILRERQKLNDRLKALHEHRHVASDPRLPLAPAPTGDARIVGRLLGTGYDDQRNQAYMLVENTGGSVHYLYQTSSAEEARRSGLNVGDVLVISQRTYVDKAGASRTAQRVTRLDTAEGMLANTRLLESEVRAFVRQHGFTPESAPWGGWLGQYKSTLAATSDRMLKKGLLQDINGRIVVTPARSQKRTGPDPQRGRTP